MMVKDFFYSLGWLFQEVLFLPFDLLRSIQLDNWYIANIVTWTFILIGIVGAAYWLKKLKELMTMMKKIKTLLLILF